MINYHKVEVTIQMEKMSPQECMNFLEKLDGFLSEYDPYCGENKVSFETNHADGTPYAGILNQKKHLHNIRKGCTCVMIEPMNNVIALDENCPMHGEKK